MAFNPFSLTPLNLKLFRDFWAIKSQALAIAAVMAAGISVYVMSVGTVESLTETRDAYYERYRFADLFAHVNRAPLSVARTARDLPGVRTVEPRIQKDVTLDMPGMAMPAVGRLLSSHMEAGGLNALHLTRGRFPDVHRDDEAVLSEAMAEAHGLVPGDTIGALINGRKRQITITGMALSPEYVYSLGPGALMPDDRMFGVLWMEMKPLAAMFDMSGAFNSLAVTLEKNARLEQVKDRIDRLLAPHGGVGAIIRADTISGWFVNNELTQLETMAWFLPPLFLGVAAFLINIVIGRIVATEREQIGLLKAFGYTDWDVAWQYLKLTLLMAVPGLVMGIGFGAWLGDGLVTLYADYFRFPFLVYRAGPEVYLVAALLTMALSLIGGIASVLRAARLAPAVAMLPAPPTAYRNVFYEKLPFFQRLSEPAKMVARHLLRWPRRTALTVLGIAVSLSLLISSNFMNDSFDALLEVTFDRAQRQDATILFTDSRPVAALHEIRALPGILRAEPFRELPVKLGNGPKRETASLRGLPESADLFRAVDVELRPLLAPEFGLVLSTKLAEKLDTGVGGRLTVEVQEGDRPVRRLPVVAVVEEYLGTPAYMSLDALNRLAGGGPRISGVVAKIDANLAPLLYERLKTLPRVASTGLRKSWMDAMNKMLEENMGTMIFFNVVFAGVITFGVVYNSARISLSERERELASLRVLGFTRAEASGILLGELAAVTMLAVPVGCLIGVGLSAFWVVALDTDVFRMPLVIYPATFGMAIIVVLISAALSGLVVRRRIDKLDMIGVLKTRE